MDGATFWSAVGAIGTCIAALVAVLALLGIPFRTKSIKLEGQWKGELGDEWDFVALLKVERDKIKGRIHWTLVECPPALPWADKVGSAGFELVNGTMENGVLTRSGYESAGIDPELLGLADYTVPFPLEGGTFEGKSFPQKRGKYQEEGVRRGKVSFFRKLPRNFA
jgi:hypothetical protein